MNNLKANLHATIYRPDFVHITDRKKKIAFLCNSLKFIGLLNYKYFKGASLLGLAKCTY